MTEESNSDHADSDQYSESSAVSGYNHTVPLTRRETLASMLGLSGLSFNYTTMPRSVTGSDPTSLIRSQGEWKQQAKLTNPNSENSNNFAKDVAIDGGTVLIGADLDRVESVSDAGSVFVFNKEMGGWNQQTKLVADDAEQNGRFGDSVAVNNDRALVGSNLDDNTNDEAAGAAYVFERSGQSWDQIQKLVASDRNRGDQFGRDVALDNELAIIGTPQDNNKNGEDAGAIYIFELTDDDWKQQAKLIADDGDAFDNFGGAVSIDEDTALVGANFDRNQTNVVRGSAYIFQRIGEDWTQQSKLKSGDAGDDFAESVALDGDYAAVGAPGELGNPNQAGSVYVFNRNDGEWSQQSKLTPDEGGSDTRFGVDVSIDGNRVLIGANEDDSTGELAGSAYVYERSGRNWVQQAKLTASDGDSFDRFGQAVAISNNKTVLAAPFADNRNGAAYVFSKNEVDEKSTIAIDKDSTRPIQITENSRIAGIAPTGIFPEPRMVAGRQTAILFGLEVDKLSDIPETGHITVTAKAPSTGASDSIDLRRSDIESIQDASSRALAGVFDSLRGTVSDGAPVLELPATDGEFDIELEIETDFDENENQEFVTEGANITAGTDFKSGIPDTTPQIGIIELVDPDGGTNYGASRNGQAVNDLSQFISSLKFQFEKRFPVIPDRPKIREFGGDPVEGTVNKTGSDAIKDDGRIAFDALAEVFEFNAAVVIVPPGYFNFHNKPWGGVHYGAGSDGVDQDSQPQIAGLSLPNVQTVLHELAHHYMPDDPYPNLAAQRDKDKNNDGEPDIDNAHARTYNRDFDNDSTVDDTPGVVSTGRVDIAFGTYGLIGSKKYPESSDAADLPEVSSTLSYDSPSAPDTLMIDTLADPSGDGGYIPRPPTVDGGAGPNTATGTTDEAQAVLSVATTRRDGQLIVTDTTVRPGLPSPEESNGDLTVTVFNNDETILAERTVPENLLAQPRLTEDLNKGLPSNERLADSTAFVIEFPDTATAIRLESDDGPTMRFNPITRTLRDLIAAIPNAAFIPTPKDTRKQLFNRLDSIKRHVRDDRYRPALNLTRSIRQTLDQVLKENYETNAAQQPTKKEVLNEIGDRISRLKTILKDSSNKGKE